MTRARAQAAALVVYLLFGGRATAQSLEITPFFGYETAGSYPLENPTDIQALRADAGRTYGLFFDYRLLQNVQAEFTWITNTTTYSAARSNPEQFEPAFHTSISQYQVGALFYLRARDFAVRPYVAGGLGFTHDSNDGSNPDRTAFSLSLGGGLKYQPSRHFGVRADARWIPTYGSSFAGTYCDIDGFCYPETVRNFLQRISLTTEIVVHL